MSTETSVASRFWAIARRPQWIAALVLCLGIAGGFAALGQWQLERSIENVDVVEIDTEAAVPLAEIAQPGVGLTEVQVGRTVTVTGQLVPRDFVTLVDRTLDGRTGSWLIGHVVTDDGVSLAVALGFLGEGAIVGDLDGENWVDRTAWTGRYLPSEEPQSSDFEAGRLSAMSVPALINIWPEQGPVYGGFLVVDGPPPGYEQIDAIAPPRDVQLNLLNLFYAIEWVIFGGFAVYLWYRLVRDAVEKELEEEAAGSDVAATVD